MRRSKTERYSTSVTSFATSPPQPLHHTWIVKVRLQQRSARSQQPMKNPFSPQSIAAVVCGFMALLFAAPSVDAQPTGPQQLVFAGLRASNNPSSQTAQFNVVQSDASGNLYLLLD